MRMCKDHRKAGDGSVAVVRFLSGKQLHLQRGLTHRQHPQAWVSAAWLAAATGESGRRPLGIEGDNVNEGRRDEDGRNGWG